MPTEFDFSVPPGVRPQPGYQAPVVYEAPDRRGEALRRDGLGDQPRFAMAHLFGQAAHRRRDNRPGALEAQGCYARLACLDIGKDTGVGPIERGDKLAVAFPAEIELDASAASAAISL